MRKIIIAAIIILVTNNVNAQPGMPKELTCTEEAFNVSFSLGTKWKLSAPKMGPVEAIRREPDYIPAWSLKHNDVTPETLLLPLAEKPLNVETFRYAVNRQNYAPLFYYNSFGTVDKLNVLFFSSPQGVSQSTLRSMMHFAAQGLLRERPSFHHSLLR